ncbi:MULTISPECIES: DUF2147 domain-containing protein [Cellulophaga]|jgi:uncharacterized protein (DUF2147 family)|uniref:Uncharacterized protein n=2 Tax=Cellulophaga baltica TaxID=76594 RepID=A0A1G7L3B1_9FLAO|nr:MULTISPECIES: DUF2147 domain-containing protein [Cellulophaga]WFO17704.1 DUF2147 domain-containing protein [Cellulophaga baltica 4]AIY13510.1 signal peptide protein [Cellulophaga baltica NN016038]AIZ41878.1 signal peptide protein [Cellulophaga baltica 18]KGK30943.1 signal peptide protein [Cellulophaga sp. E6(2014)]MBA6316085.1 DUF2147 domain-containing protein [Cellulophaga baltica]
MKFLIASIFLMLNVTLHAQSVTGKWQTIDDETGKVRSVVEIYSDNGKVFGKIIEITDKSRQDRLCEACTGANKDKPILGMVIIKDLEKDDDEWEDGTILDPESGKVYKCYITLEETNKLKVRGFIGFSLLGRTQYWTRVQ